MSEHEHEGHRERVRARFMRDGLEGFAPHEVLEFLLFFAIPRRNVNPLAHRLLNHFGSVWAVLNTPAEQLTQVPGIGAQSATLLASIAAAYRFAERDKLGERPIVNNYREAKNYCAHLFSATREEVLYVICLDAQGRVLRAVPAITGTIDEIAIYPRTIVGLAIRHNAHSVVLAHNHPSGIKDPSDADIRTTEMLREALGSVDIEVLDHIIYADGECTSMAQWQQLRRIAPAYDQQTPKAADTRRSRRRGPAPMHEQEDGSLPDYDQEPDMLYRLYGEGDILHETEDDE